MVDDVYTIRFKRGDAEFEMRGSQQQVEAAWAALEESVVGAFKGPARAALGGAPPGTNKRRRKSSRSAAGGSGGEAKATGDRATIMAASVEDFPEEIDDKTPALIAGYATLAWARDRHKVEGLTAPDIHKFLSSKLRLPNGESAYRNAFDKKPRAVQGAGRPKVYQLMKPGEQALAAYKKSVAAGGTQAEAEAQADEAEAKSR